jgi:N-methylhydantoinase B
MKEIDSVELSVFVSRMEAVCVEMGAQLRRSAFSPNIRDRLDYSCAIFDSQGGLCAQAAHIPVHLGSMAYAMHGIVTEFEWEVGDQLILNDPFLGGTHLPDVTVVAPVFVGDILSGFVANRAHYADIGAMAPGSMPLSKSLSEEGVLIPPQKICSKGRLDQLQIEQITGATRNAVDASGDLQAQLGCNLRGMERLSELVNSLGVGEYRHFVAALNDYAERIARSALAKLTPGKYLFAEAMDDDGQGAYRLPLSLCINIGADVLHGDSIRVDFFGTALQTRGNINCPLSVTAAAVWYVFRCLMPAQTPACAGCFKLIDLRVLEGTLLNARRPAAVAAGNVETSSRVVDVVLGALAQALPEKIPAASQGTMNNIAFGANDAQAWGYYETIGGGMGAGSHRPGLSSVQTHMTNTRNTPIEVLELRFPVRIVRYSVRKASGGRGRHRGGDGIVREYEFTKPAVCTLITERRDTAPWGLAGGQDGERGVNTINNRILPGKCELTVEAGDRIKIETPGGGGWG